MRLKDFWALLKDSWNAWSTDKAPRLGAALAYYMTFSLTPLLVIIIAIAALIFGQEAVQSSPGYGHYVIASSVLFSA